MIHTSELPLVGDRQHLVDFVVLVGLRLEEQSADFVGDGPDRVTGGILALETKGQRRTEEVGARAVRFERGIGRVAGTDREHRLKDRGRPSRLGGQELQADIGIDVIGRDDSDPITDLVFSRPVVVGSQHSGEQSTDREDQARIGSEQTRDGC